MSQEGGNSRSTRLHPSLQSPIEEPERAMHRQRAQAPNEQAAAEATSSTPLPEQTNPDTGAASLPSLPSRHTDNRTSSTPSLQPRQLRLVTPRSTRSY